LARSASLHSIAYSRGETLPSRPSDVSVIDKPGPEHAVFHWAGMSKTAEQRWIAFDAQEQL
jgi:hypothetical protein